MNERPDIPEGSVDECMAMALKMAEAVKGRPNWLQGGAIASLAAAWIIGASRGECCDGLLECHVDTIKALLPALQGRK